MVKIAFNVFTFGLTIILFQLPVKCLPSSTKEGPLQLIPPVSFSTCSNTRIEWNNAEGKFVSVTIHKVDSNGMIEEQSVKDFLNIDSTKGSIDWLVDISSGQNVSIHLNDSKGNQINSIPITIVQSIYGEPPCKPLIEPKMKLYDGPIGIEPPHLINQIPKEFRPIILDKNGKIIPQFNTPMFLNSSSPVPVIPVVIPKIGKINDSAPVLVMNPNGSSTPILMPGQIHHNSAFGKRLFISSTFLFSSSSTVIVLIGILGFIL